MKRFSLLALLAVIIAALALVGCGGGGGGGTDLSGGGDDGGDIVSPPDAPGDDPGTDPGTGDTLTFITGRVVDQDSGAGVPNVTVIVTNMPELVSTYTTKTTSTGDFQVALQDGTSILSLFDPLKNPATFAIRASTAGTQYLDSTQVLYNSMQYNQGSIAFDLATLLNTGDLGMIGIKSTTPSGGGDIEDPPDVPPAL